MHQSNKKVSIISMNVDLVTRNSLDSVLDFLINKTSSSYVCLSNVHMCIECYDSQAFRDVVNAADLTLADGRPIYWAQKMLGYNDVEHIRGLDFVNLLLKYSSEKNLNIGLYGGSSDDVLNSVVRRIKSDFPNLNVVFSYSPPFRPLTKEEDINVCEQISSSKVDVLFVGIGCPKQEFWMADHSTKVSCMMIGVGAVFDFLSGEKKHAPLWMQNAGLEWLFRLGVEPKRLWKRYLRTNPRFIYYFILQFLFNKSFIKEGPKNV